MAKTEDGKTVRIARQQFVRVGEARGDFMEVAEGAKAGDEVVTAGAFKLRNGSPIVIDESPNAGGPAPSLNPHPQNR
jgi:membrane fusion protein (multidrug efflux system)